MSQSMRSVPLLTDDAAPGEVETVRNQGLVKPSGNFGLYAPQHHKDSCGVGFLTRKDGVQTHELMLLAHEALCAVPHRGGMSSEGVGDGAGVSVDLSTAFFSKIVGKQLTAGTGGMESLAARDVPVDNNAIRPEAIKHQLLVRQWVFAAPEGVDAKAFDRAINKALLAIEAVAYTDPALEGLYPISLSAQTQVFKGRLNSNELDP